MELSIVLDTSTIQWKPEGTATGVVYWVVGDMPFPEIGWNDFVSVLFDWWSRAILRILRGEIAIERLRFMDGPFWIVAERHDDEIRLRFVDGRHDPQTLMDVPMTGVELCEAILDSARRLCGHCRSVGAVMTDEIVRIEECCKSLSILLRELKRNK
jgi:hypothetical protein